MLGAGLAVPLVATGRISGAALGQVVLLLVFVVCLLAAVHLDRNLLWLSGLLAAGYGALFCFSAWGWTVVGITPALGLAGCALVSVRGRAVVAF